MGIQWGALTSSSAASSTTGSTTTSTAGGAGFQQFGEGIVGIIPHMQIQAVLSMLQTTTGANILSTPSIVVLDNRKATLSVGQQVAEQTGQYSTTGLSSTVTPFNTVGRLDVQLRLDVTPQINLGSAVRLGIKLKNDSLQNPDNPTLNPATNTSLIQNSVLVNSADVLVIGGLISNNITSSMDKIPLLGDLPGIGILFQHKTRRLEKKNLMVFIKPTILYNNDDASAITNTKYTLVRHSQMDWPEDLTHEGMQKLQNTLPPFGETRSLPRPFENET
jgi:general secretion pathway protein D